VLALALVFTVTPVAVQAQGRGASPPAQGGLPAVQTRVQALEQQVADVRTSLDAVRAEVGAGDAAQQALITALTAQLATASAGIATLQAQMTTASTDVTALQAQVTAVGVDLTGLQALFSSLNAAVNNSTGDILELQGQVAALAEDLAELSEAAGALSLAGLAGSACTTPTSQEGSIEITQSASGVAILRCRAGTGRFIANGDETITDTQTGLMWETKVAGSSCLRCMDDTYDWNAAKGDWLGLLNGRSVADSDDDGFAGYSDWRLPTLAELRTIVQAGSAPAIDAVFGPTAASPYWSASTHAPNPTFAWFASFGDGFVFAANKTFLAHVRAVRGGP
jgi:hypothetical protein